MADPSHFPRDESRNGRQIDVIWIRQIDHHEVVLEPDRRHVIGSDHALLHTDIYCRVKTRDRWGNDSRPRFICRDIPTVNIDDAERLAEIAKKCTCPRRSTAYEDDEQIKKMISEAKLGGDKRAWKMVHRARRRAR